MRCSYTGTARTMERLNTPMAEPYEGRVDGWVRRLRLFLRRTALTEPRGRGERGGGDGEQREANRKLAAGGRRKIFIVSGGPKGEARQGQSL